MDEMSDGHPRSDPTVLGAIIWFQSQAITPDFNEVRVLVLRERKAEAIACTR